MTVISVLSYFDRTIFSKYSSKTYKKFIVFFIILTTLLILLRSYSTLPFQNPLLIELFDKQQLGYEEDDLYAINTPGCHLPHLDPFDPAILSYIYKEENYECGPPPLILSNETSIWINQERMETFNTTVECCYRAFWRTEFEEDTGIVQDREITKDTNCTSLVNATQIYDEFIQVTCSNSSGLEVYKDFHAFVVRKRPEEVQPRQSSRTKPSVIIIGLDTVQRANLKRQLPKTVKFLENVGAIEFSGFNKIGDNTYPNAMAMLTGQTVDEIESTCLNTTNRKYDACPFVWKEYQEHGYLTAFAEDTCWMGLFLYQKNGFFKQPTDYYTQAYMRLNEEEIGYNALKSAWICATNRIQLEILFDYTKRIYKNVTDEHLPFFGYVWGTSYSHDYVNIPPQADDFYLNFMSDLKESGVLENSIVFFMSDHGLRWGSFRWTFQGKIESNLPFLYTIVPTWFESEYPKALENLKINTRRLTTMYDIHATLQDLLDMESLRDSNLKNRKPHTDVPGLSLFMPIPDTRTCSTAGIDPEWCVCSQSMNISVNNPLAVIASKAVVDQMNNLMSKHKDKCAEIKLKETLSARVEIPPDGVTDSSEENILVAISTSPNDGMFEATVTYDKRYQTVSETGYISRTNIYGNQSHCINEYLLKLYCYCDPTLLEPATNSSSPSPDT